jgi:hypothetical protein
MSSTESSSSLQPQVISSNDLDVSKIESMANSPAKPSQRAAAQPHIKAEEINQAQNIEGQPNRISDQQYMSAFSQYEIYCVSMAPRVYTSQQIADQINQIKNTVFKDKNIPDVTEKKVSELRELITKNRDDKRAAYAKFKEDRNSDTLSTKMAALNKSAGERLGRLGVTVGKSLNSLKATTKETIPESASDVGKRFASLRKSASDAAPNLTFSFGKKSAVNESAATVTPPPPSPPTSFTYEPQIRSPPAPYQARSIFHDDDDDDDEDAPPPSRADRLAKASSAKPANLFDDDDDEDDPRFKLALPPGPAPSKSEKLIDPNTLVNIDDIKKYKRMFTRYTDNGFKQELSKLNYDANKNLMYDYKRGKQTILAFVDSSDFTNMATTADQVLKIINKPTETVDSVSKITLINNLYTTLQPYMEQADAIISVLRKAKGLSSSDMQDVDGGSKRKRTIKRKHRSIRDNTLRSKK